MTHPSHARPDCRASDSLKHAQATSEAFRKGLEEVRAIAASEFLPGVKVCWIHSFKRTQDGSKAIWREGVVSRSPSGLSDVRVRLNTTGVDHQIRADSLFIIDDAVPTAGSQS